MAMTYEEWNEAKKDIKRRFSICSWALLIYNWIMNVSVIGIMVAEILGKLFSGLLSGEYADIDMIVTQSAENAWGYFLAAAVGFALLLIWKKPRYLKQEIFVRGKPMRAGDFFTLLCIFISGQLVFQLGVSVLEWILNCFGYTVAAGLESLQADPDNFGMFLYAGILAPIAEEILFRGLVQRTMLPFGKKFAIFVSSLTFGLFHGNLIQTPYAFAVGLVLGYVAAEYNILWAMVLHMINNLVLGDMLYRLLGNLPVETVDIIIWGIILAFSVMAVILIIVRRKEIAAWLRCDHIIGAYLGCYFSCAGTIVLLVFMMINTAIATFAMVAPL